MSRSLIMGLIAVILIAGGGFFVLSMDKDDSANNSSTTPTTTPTQSDRSTTTPPTASDTPANTTDTDEGDAAAATISYTDNGFSPDSVTVKSGDTVTIENTSEDNVQFNSDPHPSHTENSELNVGMIAAGDAKSFIVTKKGSFGFHNHLNSSQKGTISVE